MVWSGSLQVVCLLVMVPRLCWMVSSVSAGVMITFFFLIITYCSIPYAFDGRIVPFPVCFCHFCHIFVFWYSVVV